MSFKLLIILPIILFSNISYSDECFDWFKESKVYPEDTDCEIKCGVLKADMTNYFCNTRCHSYCSKKIQCKIDPYWKQKFSNEKPQKWNIKSEVASSWTKDEKRELENILSQLPDIFKTIGLGSIYRMKKSIQIMNPGTTQDNDIVLYDNAFGDHRFSLDHVIIHELSHILFLKLSKNEKNDYESHMGWTRTTFGSQRDGKLSLQMQMKVLKKILLTTLNITS